MIQVRIDYDLNEGSWFYYFHDSEQFKTKVEGFKTSVLARLHAEEYVLDCKIQYT